MREHRYFIIMKIINTNEDKAVEDLFIRLKNALDGGSKILWLVSGGSNIDLTIRILERLKTTNTDDLAIMLSDERFGPSGHPDSNAQKLLEAGLNNFKVKFIPTLQDLSLEETKKSYAEEYKKAAEGAEVVFQLGMGTDGHIAGILPNSPAIDDNGVVAAYQGPDFSRLTLTFPIIGSANWIYVFAFGESKKESLLKLSEQELDKSELPIQFLKSLPNVYIYNNQIGEKI